MEQTKKKNKKVIAFAFGLLMCCAAVGVGFAVNYYGTVDNTDNDADAAYYMVSLDTDGDGTYDEATDFLAAFSGRIYFDTVNSSAGVDYIPHDAVTISGAICVPIKTITAKVTGAEGSASYDPYTLSITHGSAWAGAYKMGIAVGAGSASYYDMDIGAGSGCEVNVNGAAETIFTITLYYVAGTSTVTPPVGPMFENEVFTFTVDATATE